jgi:hypothetical protein
VSNSSQDDNSRCQPLDAAKLADASAAKAAVSDRYFAKADQAPLAPFVLRRKIQAIQRAAGSQIHAIGIGRKEEFGKATNTVCIRFYVTQKLPKRLLSAAAMIDREIDGVRTDVIEAAPAYLAVAMPVCSRDRRKRKRPVRPGTSIGNVAVAGGTLAIDCVSRLPGDAGKKLLLSNSHVLADYGAAIIGSPIYQPSRADGGTEQDQVARLLRFDPVIENALATNLVDAAVAEVDPGIAVGSEICTVGRINGIAIASDGMQVHKHARTTGYTIGVVDDLSCDVLIPVSRADPLRQARFVDQIRIRARSGSARFAQVGDSGALIVSKGTNRAIGLMFACPDNGAYAYANPIQAVLDRLSIDLG